MAINDRDLPGGSLPCFDTLRLWAEAVDEGADKDAALATLSPDEHARAQRYRFERDRVHFVARRAFLRRVLADHVGIAPDEIVFRSSGHGRPTLDPGTGIDFNATHSHGLAVVAVTTGRRVGVDIERVRPIDDALDIAERSFTPPEADLVRSATGQDRALAFLTIWTRKESYVKAVGAGLTLPLDGFDVASVDAAGRGRPLGPAGDAGYTFAGIDGLDGYVGAVTVSDASAGLADLGGVAGTA